MFLLRTYNRMVYTIIINSKGGYQMSKQSQETLMYRKYLKEYNKKAKAADRKMRELERFSRYDEFKSIKKYAYAKAEKMIEGWTPPGSKSDKPRWQRNAPADTRTLKAKIKDIDEFLNMKTSTVTGVKEVYKKRAQTINERYGTNFTWQQLATFFEEHGMADKTFDKYGSKTVLVSFGKIQKKKATALSAIQKFNDQHKKIDDNAVVQETVKGMLQGYGVELSALLKG